MMTGGFSEIREADEEVKILANQMKSKVENKLGESYDIFEAVLYTTQVVAGTNYKIKVNIGDERFVHIKIYVPLQVYNENNELLECESDRTLFDPLS